jgi:arylesterase / paraoxonase
MRLVAFIIVLLVLAGAAFYATLNSFNYFDDVERSFAGQCTPVAGIAGPEDIQIDAARSRVFISSRDRRTDAARGAIHVFDIANPLGAEGWRDMTMGLPTKFKPLGLDYYEDDEVRRLFVVNEAGKSVEMFDVKNDGMLVHLETFNEPRLTSPNNVVAVGRRSFYVTNDVQPGRNTRIGRIHFLTRQASGQVFFTNGASWRVAAEGLRFANGIEASADGARIYVAETAGGAVQVYDRDLETGVLSLGQTIRLDASPDNITVDDAGVLWVAALPQPLSVPAHAGNSKNRAPSEVIRIGEDGAPRTIYRDNGRELSASTAAARFGRTLIIGALYDEKFLICDLPAGEI